MERITILDEEMYATYLGKADKSPKCFAMLEYMQRCYEIATHVSSILNAPQHNRIKIYYISFRFEHLKTLS